MSEYIFLLKKSCNCSKLHTKYNNVFDTFRINVLSTKYYHKLTKEKLIINRKILFEINLPI